MSTSFIFSRREKFVAGDESSFEEEGTHIMTPSRVFRVRSIRLLDGRCSLSASRRYIKFGKWFHRNRAPRKIKKFSLMYQKYEFPRWQAHRAISPFMTLNYLKLRSWAIECRFNGRRRRSLSNEPYRRRPGCRKDSENLWISTFEYARQQSQLSGSPYRLCR